ncbi:uncharacterized protein BDR25DRAFT_117512 [Lindgomyces ingoldianus]|uniref:Uncharacterized protein n=1 Tax=Lindgomyces ingoldianus TaxID=673940 RepID=A0ACB6Q7Y6_9PLEO|nr:uncharacterized protein BDR25DRAFT_117512 [Lindgomyces ingoldianus]KAF2462971.1 hypothetical protein BDR25DRAFT_117512 [Lindgomyces ingoldianus]
MQFSPSFASPAGAILLLILILLLLLPLLLLLSIPVCLDLQAAIEFPPLSAARYVHRLASHYHAYCPPWHPAGTAGEALRRWRKRQTLPHAWLPASEEPSDPAVARGPCKVRICGFRGQACCALCENAGAGPVSTFVSAGRKAT